jgi:hypothetical protein
MQAAHVNPADGSSMWSRMRIPFEHRGPDSEVSVTVEVVRDATAVGKPAGTEGYPFCEAVVVFCGQGYDAMFGWVQLVRSNDFADGEFAFDALRHFEDSPSPYGFYGCRPTLFDAPSRDERKPLDWIAHSFLAPLGIFDEDRLVQPLLGFSWGFDIDGAAQIAFKPIECLTPGDWAKHLGRAVPRLGLTAWL